jgi:hypothetical protein
VVTNDALPALHSSDDNENDNGHGHQGDVYMSNHVSIGGVGCGGASPDPSSYLV